MRNSGSCDIDQTLEALEQIIKQKKVQMQTSKVPSGPIPVVSHLFSEMINRAGGSYGQINVALEQGSEFARNFIHKVQKNVEERPWDSLRKVAVYSFGIGLFLGLRRRRKS